jgi:MoxR-like ATPase
MTVDSTTHPKIVRAGQILSRVRGEVGRAVVGQQTMIDRLLIGLLTGGHVLLEGVPGLAKTLAVKSLADSLSLTFRRIQFTPDLLPADLTGTLIYNPRDGTFAAKRGPLFAHLVLADEINRAPAKVQSALLEAMQEKQVTLGDQSHPLDEPFLVLATQNPIEQEGTYPLPEAQSDRFMLKVKVSYPARAEEKEILRRAGLAQLPSLTPQATRQDVLDARDAAERGVRRREDPGLRARPRDGDAAAEGVRPQPRHARVVRRQPRARRCSSSAARRRWRCSAAAATSCRRT